MKNLNNYFNSIDLYKDVCAMFFVDWDQDKSLSTENENVYETPYYSIENLYAQEQCLKIL